MTTHTENLSRPARTSSFPIASRAFEILTKQGARALFALPFAVFGLFHFTGADQMAAMVPVPGGVFWVYFTGAALLAGSAGILTGILGKWAGLGLAALMALFALTVHVPHLGDAAMGQMAMISLLKDLSLAGGALAFAGIFARNTK